MSDETKKWDWKQVGSGAGGSLLVLFLFQEQGFNLMNKAHEQRALANTQRIEILEAAVKENFTQLRSQLRDDVEKIRDDIKESMTNRWTKSDHNEYAREERVRNDRRFEKIEDDILELQRERSK